MSSTVGDSSELRKRKQQAEAEAVGEERSRASAGSTDAGEENQEMDEEERKYVEYFRQHYGENPRSDILGIDGFALFCLIYVVVAGVVLSILYFSVYARNRAMFHPNPK
mmetsp:Transcript_20153/g.56648  ORF Transcript_20153/g.56648 Transcript_20153/m.56648 type:complete len:109 (+) Transcript_20153:69-395(+)